MEGGGAGGRSSDWTIGYKLGPGLGGKRDIGDQGIVIIYFWG